MQPVGLQEWIHKFEEGEGTKYIRLAFFLLALLGVTALWHLREAKNFAAPEAMDAAQLARNIAQGRGYTTKNIRPLSIALIEEHIGKTSPALVTEPHPDLANPPVYPLILAGLMKVLPFHWEVPAKAFWRYQPETIIGGFNQLLFFISLFLVFRVTTRLFDPAVAYLAVVLMALTELYWEFVTSGLSTMLLVVLFLLLCWVLILFEQGAREGTRGKGGQIGLALFAGLLVGVMALTRYSMGWLIIPVAGFIAVVGGGVRSIATPASIAVVLVALAPWVARNYQVGGTLFGTAGLAINEGTTVFQGHELERSMPRNIQRHLNNVDVNEYPRKLFVNAGNILMNAMSETTGNWIAAFFLVGLLMPFQSPALKRFRWFAAATFFTLVIVQALGRTEFSADTPRINSENLLAVCGPLCFILGTGFLFVILDQIEFPIPWLRSVAIVGMVVVLSLPLILRLLPPRTYPVNYPPYYPPTIQIVSQWLGEDELLMTDMPWATAWYGDRTSVWTTLDYGAKTQDDFYRIHDEHRAIMGLYLTPLTTDAKFLTVMRQSKEGVWGKFYLDAAVLRNLPSGFPLKIGPPALLPEQMFLSDRIRWRQ